MNLVTAEHLTKSYTERLLFDDTDFSINEGEKVGLIGVNGTGKSTLLKIVAGLEEPDSGRVVRGAEPGDPLSAAESCFRRRRHGAPVRPEGQRRA